MKPKTVQHRIRCSTLQQVQIRAVTSEAPAPGTCGAIAFIGLRYNQPDAYGTIFKPGCLAKTAQAKVAKGIVKYFGDHIYKWRTHLGVIRSLEDVGNDVLVKADILDTSEGREYLEYAKACLASNTQTGASIGFWDRASDVEELNGQRYLAYSEIELEEFSGTPMNAVDGADLLNARRLPDAERRASMMSITERLLATLPEADARQLLEQRVGTGHAESEEASAPRATPPLEETPAASAAPVLATPEQRHAALRQSFSLR